METRTIKIRLVTYRLLKILAAENGETLIDLISRLAETERNRENRNVATSVANTKKSTSNTAS